MSSTDPNPLLLECTSLRNELRRFQDEAYQSSIKFQRHSLNVSQIQERNLELERENSLLRDEIDVLRSHSLDTLTSDDSRISEFTLALRKLSSKLAETENNLLFRIQKDVERDSELFKSKNSADIAYELSAHYRSELEQGRVREANLETKLQVLEKQCQSYNSVILEYATLVRKLEARSSSSSSGSPPSSPSHSTNQDALQELTNEFTKTHAALQQQLSDLNLALSKAELKARSEAEAADAAKSTLSRLSHDLEKIRVDDLTAAAMVERYMKFTQSQSVALHSKLDSLQLRHASTVNTLESQLSQMEKKNRFQLQTDQQLRNALDELGNELMKEKFGRRREVLLRMNLLQSLEQVKRQKALPLDVPAPENVDLLAITNAATVLNEELRWETARRMELELLQAKVDFKDPTVQNGIPPVQVPLPNIEEAKSPLVEIIPALPDETSRSDPEVEPLSEPPSPTQPLITLTENEDLSEADPLLISLRATCSRYDALSQSLKDCHVTLMELQGVATESTTFEDSTLSKEVVQAALERLCDYAEDTRVQLEIRCGDEALLASGFETLLGLRKSSPNANLSQLEDLDGEIEAFISGADPSVKKALENLRKKTMDLEHDVAIMKRAVYEPTLAREDDNPSSPTRSGNDDLEDRSDWAGWLRRSPSPHLGMGSVSPRNQTFGNIMASRSLQRHSSPSSNVTKSDNPFVTLGLNVPMPSHVKGLGAPPPLPTTSRQQAIGGVMLGLGAKPQRPRTTSGVGLGVGRRFVSSPPLQSKLSDGEGAEVEEGSGEVE